MRHGPGEPSWCWCPGGDAEAWRHQLGLPADTAGMRVAGLRACRSRAEMAAAILGTTPERFAVAGHSMGGWVRVIDECGHGGPLERRARSRRSYGTG